MLIEHSPRALSFMQYCTAAKQIQITLYCNGLMFIIMGNDCECSNCNGTLKMVAWFHLPGYIRYKPLAIETQMINTGTWVRCSVEHSPRALSFMQYCTAAKQIQITLYCNGLMFIIMGNDCECSNCNGALKMVAWFHLRGYIRYKPLAIETQMINTGTWVRCS